LACPPQLAFLYRDTAKIERQNGAAGRAFSSVSAELSIPTVAVAGELWARPAPKFGRWPAGEMSRVGTCSTLG
jgi:hypothetical protein